LMAIATYLSLWQRDLLDRKFCMFLRASPSSSSDDSQFELQDSSGRVFNEMTAGKIVSFRRLARKWANKLMVFVMVCLDLYFVQQVWRKALYDPANLFMFFVTLPLVVTYAVMGS